MSEDKNVGAQAIASNVPAIEMIDLCKTFGSLKAIDHLSLTVQQGEIFGLLGPNGSGKTTTINMISGLSTPTSGQVKVMGYDVRHDARRVHQLLGSVPQETALYEELSAWTNMDFHADLFGIPRREKKERITKMLGLVQLLDRKNSRVSTFSGGMKRRLALARALLQDPQLIYLDEPTLGVDVQSRRAIWDYILSLHEQGKSVLITTNYLEEAQVLCDRLAIIDHGKLIAVDTPEDLKQKYGGSVIELETARSGNALAQLRALPGVQEVTQDGTHLKISTRGANNIVPQIINIISREGELRDIAVREPNLDEIFLLRSLPQRLNCGDRFDDRRIIAVGNRLGTRVGERDYERIVTLSRPSMVHGKMLGAFAVSFMSVAILLGVLIFVIGVRPDNWGEVIGFSLLTLIIFIAFGTLLGTLLKQRQPVVALAFGVTIPLFFLSGAFGPISFNTAAIQVIAQIFPVYYAIVLMQHAFHNFTLNTLGTGINVLILCAYARGSRWAQSSSACRSG